MGFRIISYAKQGGIPLRDVKNEGRSDYVYENKGDADRMSAKKHALLHKSAPIVEQLTRIEGTY
jgi:hypothetical protein